MPYQPNNNDVHRVCRMIELPISPDAMIYIGDKLADAQETIEENSIVIAVGKIRRYLAAHYYTLERPQEKAGKEDGFSYTLDVASLGKGFEATRFGQQALAEDVSGKLKQLNDPSTGKRPIIQAL